MKKIFKHLIALSIAFTLIFSFISCSSEKSFYQIWSAAGATIEEDNCFKTISYDEVKSKNNNKETYMLFIGNSADSKAVSDVTKIEGTKKLTNYTGKIYFFDITDYKKATEKQNIYDDIKVPVSEAAGVIAAFYKNGSLEYHTVYNSVNNEFYYFEKIDMFITSGDKSTTSQIDIIAIAEYTFTYYPVDTTKTAN